MKTLNPKQIHFLKTRLIPFTQNLGHQEDFTKTLEIVLENGKYDRVDKIIIEFLTDKLKELEK